MLNEIQGMTLTYKTKTGGEEKKEVRVLFDPPLSGYEEVKPRLMNMKADADEALGVVRRCISVSYFARTHQLTLGNADPCPPDHDIQTSIQHREHSRVDCCSGIHDICTNPILAFIFADLFPCQSHKGVCAAMVHQWLLDLHVHRTRVGGSVYVVVMQKAQNRFRGGSECTVCVSAKLDSFLVYRRNMSSQLSCLAHQFG